MTPLIPISGLLTPALVTTYLLLCVLAAIGMFVVAVDIWRSRATPAGRFALAVVGCILGWLLAVLLALLSPTASLALFWHATARFVFVVALAPLVIFYFACYFGVPRFTRELVVGVGLIPGLTILLVLTNGLNHWFLASYTMQRIGPYFVRAAWAPGPWFPIYSVFTFLSTLGASVALVWSCRQRALLYRRQAWVVTLAMVAPAALFAFDTLSRSPLAVLGLTPLGFAVTALLLTWGLRHEQVLDLVPVAREAIFAGMVDPVFVLDARGRIIDLNPAAAAALGRTAATVVGASIEALVSLPRRIVDPLKDLQSPGTEGAEGEAGEHDWRDWRTSAPTILDLEHEGETRRYDVRLSPFGLRAGRADGQLLVLRDITELKQAEIRLIEQTNQLNAIFEAMADGIAVFDPQGRFVRANRAMEQMYGFASDNEFTALPLAERAQRLQIYDEQGQRLPAEQWPHWQVLHGEDLTGARALDTRAVALDGREVWVSTTGAPIRGLDDATTGVVLVARDVTARRQLEHDMMYRAREVTAVFDAIAEGITIHDAHGRITEYNRAFLDLLGISADTEYLSSSYPRRVGTLRPRGSDGQPIAHEQMLLTRALQGEVIPADEASDTILTTPDDREIVLSQSAVPIRDAQGQIVGATIVHRDVTHHRHLERQVQEQADQLAAIFEATADGVGVFDRQRRLVRANRAWQAILKHYGDVTGLSADPAFAALPLADQVDRLVLHDEHGHIIPREERPTARALRGETMTGASAVDEWMHNPVGEAVVVLNVSAAPIRDATGQITGAVTTVRDVTARRLLEREVAEQASQLAAIFEAQADVVVVYDQQRRFVRGNRAWEDFGKQIADTRGRTIQSAFATLPSADRVTWLNQQIQDEHGDLIPGANRPTARALQGETVTGSAAVDEWYQLGEDRDMLLNVSAAPIRDHAGQITGAVVVGRDVTTRRALERQVAEQKGQLEAIFEALADGVVMYDQEGRMVRANRTYQAMFQAFTGLTDWSAERTVAELPFAAQVERWQQSLRERQHALRDVDGHEMPLEATPTYRALRGETLRGVDAVDERFDTTDGHVYVMSVSAAPVYDAAGQIVGAVSVARDVTAHRRLERQVREHITQAATEAERARLARELHDTVTQELYAASLMAETLPRLWAQHPAKGEQALGQIHEITQSGLATLRLLLFELRPDGLDEMTLPALLQLLLRAMHTRAGVPMSLDIAGDEDSWSLLPQEVKAALYRMAQEAVTNAVKYATASQITLRLRRGRRGSLHIEIADDGVGFDPDTSMPGHLGLTIMHERAREIGATVDVRSQAGQGTQVVIGWLGPAGAGPEQPSVAATRAATEPPGEGSKP